MNESSSSQICFNHVFRKTPFQTSSDCQRKTSAQSSGLKFDQGPPWQESSSCSGFVRAPWLSLRRQRQDDHDIFGETFQLPLVYGSSGIRTLECPYVGLKDHWRCLERFIQTIKDPLVFVFCGLPLNLARKIWQTFCKSQMLGLAFLSFWPVLRILGKFIVAQTVGY